MKQTYVMDILAGQAGNATDTGAVDLMPQKLKAEDFSTADIDGVAHSAAGSGQLNYMMLQAQQTREAQSQSLLDTAVGGSGDIGNMAVADMGAARGGLPSAGGEGTGSSGGQGNGGFGASVWHGGSSVDMASNETKGSGVAVGSISAASGQGGSEVNNGYRNFNQAQSNSSTSNTFNNSTSSLNVNGGNTVVNTTNTTQTTNTYTTTTINNYEGSDPVDPTPHGHGPLLHLDVNALLGTTLTPLENVVGQAGDVVGGLLGGVPDLLGTPLSALPENVLATLDNALTGTGDILGTIAYDVIGGATDLLGNVTGILAPTLADLAAGSLSVGSTFDRLGLGGNQLDLRLDVRGLGAIDVPVAPLIESVVQTADSVLADVQGVVIDVLAPLGVQDVLQDAVAQLTPTLDGLDTGLQDVLNDIASGVNALPDLLADAGDALQDPLGAVTDGLGDVLAPLDGVLAPVQEVLADVVGSILTDNPVQDLVGGLVDGLGLANSGADTDLLLNVPGLGLLEDMTLNPLEGVLGDIDITLNLDNLANPADLLDLNIDALNGDLGSGLDVSAVVGDVLAHATDSLGDVVQGVPELLGDLGAALNDGLNALPDATGGTVANLLDGVGDALGFGGQGGDTDIVGDVDLSGLGHGLGVDLEVPLDPVEHLVGDIDLNVGLGDVLGDGHLPELDLGAVVNLAGLDDHLGLGNDSVHDLGGGFLGELGSVASGLNDVAEQLVGSIGGGVLDNLNETVSDLLPPVAPVVESIAAPVVNHLADVIVNVPAPLPVVVNVVSNLTGGHHGGGHFGLF